MKNLEIIKNIIHLLKYFVFKKMWKNKTEKIRNFFKNCEFIENFCFCKKLKNKKKFCWNNKNFNKMWKNYEKNQKLTKKI